MILIFFKYSSNHKERENRIKIPMLPNAAYNPKIFLKKEILVNFSMKTMNRREGVVFFIYFPNMQWVQSRSSLGWLIMDHHFLLLKSLLFKKKSCKL